jgi:hypothetical protein
MDKDELEREYLAAVAAERVAWEQARGKHKGSPKYDEQAWNAWVKAAERVRACGEKLKNLARAH